MQSPKVQRHFKGPKYVLLQKANGQLTPRVQKVGPEHFGIVAVDPAKARSRYLFVDFYGNPLLYPTTVSHLRSDLDAAIESVRNAMREHQIQDVVVAIERTGLYHRPIQLAFRAAGFETRLVHPFTSKQYRQTSDPNNKTDDTDLAAIWRATTQGFGLAEPPWPELYRTIQLLRRHRRDLVEKRAILRCQIREVLHAAMPGYAECFCHLWEGGPAPLVFARHTTSPQEVLHIGLAGLRQIASTAGLRCQEMTFHKIHTWAQSAPPVSPNTLESRLILTNLHNDHQAKTKEITDLEKALAHLVVETPYVILMAIPGINLITVADLAGEMGPIALYPNANAITGRAGLVPSRYQSDKVDRPNGPLQRRANRRLRAALMLIADHLAHKNHHFQAYYLNLRRAGKDPRWIRVKIAKTFTRIALAMVAGRQFFPHPCCQPRTYIMSKLLAFHLEHAIDIPSTQRNLQLAVTQLPVKILAQEAEPLQKELETLAHRRGPQPLAEILPLVLARLASRVVQSKPDERTGP
jgi:transposase